MIALNPSRNFKVGSSAILIAMVSVGLLIPTLGPL